jgi:hypothetical protein
MSLNVNIYLQKRVYNVYVRCFLCATCLPTSLIMYVPISVLHAQWHWCLHFSMSLNSQRFRQLHPTSMLVAYVYSIIIRQKLLSCFFFLQNQIKFSYDRVQVFHRFEVCFHENKENGGFLTLKLDKLCFKWTPCKDIWTKKITKINDFIPLIHTIIPAMFQTYPLESF